nr:hypothetical protein [Tanacetum cinerariifolium]
IWKWSPEVNYASDQMSHLQRTLELEDLEEIPLEDIFKEIKNMVSRRISKGESSNEKQKTPM